MREKPKTKIERLQRQLDEERQEKRELQKELRRIQKTLSFGSSQSAPVTQNKTTDAKQIDTQSMRDEIDFLRSMNVNLKKELKEVLDYVAPTFPNLMDTIKGIDDFKSSISEVLTKEAEWNAIRLSCYKAECFWDPGNEPFFSDEDLLISINPNTGEYLTECQRNLLKDFLSFRKKDIYDVMLNKLKEFKESNKPTNNSYWEYIDNLGRTLLTVAGCQMQFFDAIFPCK